jgi:hypothetical protein
MERGRETEKAVLMTDLRTVREKTRFGRGNERSEEEAEREKTIDLRRNAFSSTFAGPLLR